MRQQFTARSPKNMVEWAGWEKVGNVPVAGGYAGGRGLRRKWHKKSPAKRRGFLCRLRLDQKGQGVIVGDGVIRRIPSIVPHLTRHRHAISVAPISFGTTAIVNSSGYGLGRKVCQG